MTNHDHASFPAVLLKISSAGPSKDRFSVLARKNEKVTPEDLSIVRSKRPIVIF